MPSIYDPSVLFPINGGDGAEGFVLNGAAGLDYLGRSVQLSGDVTGDGRADLLTGIPLFGASEGALAVIKGQSRVPMGPEGLNVQDVFDGTIDPPPGWVAHNPGIKTGLGRRVRYLGDLDGDGIGDLGVAASITLDGSIFTGEIFIVYGGPDIDETLADLTQLLPANGGDGSRGFVINGLPDGELVGRDFFGNHDLTGNGLTDLVVHARNYYETDRGLGSSFVLFGRSGRTWPPLITYADLLALAPPDGFRVVPPDPEAPIPSSDPGWANVRLINDLTGDDRDEIVLCRSFTQYADGDLDGECYLVFGRPGPGAFPALLDLGSLLLRNGGDGSEGLLIRGSRSNECLGASLFGGITSDSDQVDDLGDFDRDGYNDLLIGAAGCGAPGRAYVLYGQPQWPAELHLGDPASGGALRPRLMRLFPPAEISDNRGFGQAVAGLGDFNGNGYPDLSVFTTFAPPLDRTGAFVIYGGPDLPEDFHTAELYPENGGDGSRGFLFRDFPGEQMLGTAISAGDFNGDGGPDIAMGAFNSSPNGIGRAGRVAVLYGRGTNQIPVPAFNGWGLMILAVLLAVTGGVLLITARAGATRSDSY